MLRTRRLSFLCTILFAAVRLVPAQEVFDVDLTDTTADVFKVTLYPRTLTDSNSVFQFASTAPGTYQEMDIGRFVSEFKAFDGSGEVVASEHTSTNQWTISRPASVRKITYAVADIWHSKVVEHRIFPMSSTTITPDFAMINGQGVFGYFSGRQTDPLRIRLRYPATWKVGTALSRDREGYYLADDFDKVVDSPFYLGMLSTASTSIGGATVEVYTYSKTGLISSDTMLAHLRPILNAESAFMKGLPVDRYVFLFYFGSFQAGAWEHSYSSEYVFRETPLTPRFSEDIATIVAHEFFHINIPLHVHSELVEHFNFVKPVMSQHLWLYEGTTEWAAHILQLRDSLVTLPDYLRSIQSEMNANDSFDPTISLTTLGVHSTEMQDQYLNIYQKGALVSTLLDIRLLELSHGTMGLRELLMRLAAKYGPHRAFSEETFFDEIVAMTYPEIRDFIDRYIRGTDKLPVRDYFGWLGINYSEAGDVDSSRASLGVGLRPVESGIGVTKVFDYSKSGLQKGDVIEKIDGTPLTFQNAQKLFGKMTEMRPGDTLAVTVKREGKSIDIHSVLVPRIMRHSFTVNPDPTPEQKMLRDAWTRNL